MAGPRAALGGRNTDPSYSPPRAGRPVPWPGIPSQGKKDHFRGSVADPSKKSSFASGHPSGVFGSACGLGGAGGGNGPCVPAATPPDEICPGTCPGPLGRGNEGRQNPAVLLPVRKLSSRRRRGLGGGLFRRGPRNPCRHATTGQNPRVRLIHGYQPSWKSGVGTAGLGRGTQGSGPNIAGGMLCIFSAGSGQSFPFPRKNFRFRHRHQKSPDKIAATSAR